MFTYEETTPEDAEALSRLYGRYLNGADALEAWIRESLRSDGFCGRKCLEGKKIVGAVTAKRGVEFTCGHYELAREIEQRWSGHTLYTADMGVVLPSYRGRGIAKTLLRLVRDELLARGCMHIVTELWLRGDVDFADEHRSQILAPVCKYWGELYTIGEFPDFYHELGRYGMTCPYCGGGKCVCGALVGVVDLSGGRSE
jgi:GNAT superfamily N-acetyltransferase